MAHRVRAQLPLAAQLAPAPCPASLRAATQLGPQVQPQPLARGAIQPQDQKAKRARKRVIMCVRVAVARSAGAAW